MDRGHKVGFARGIYGGYQAILWDDISKVYHGASESRKDGQAAGYWNAKIRKRKLINLAFLILLILKKSP